MAEHEADEVDHAAVADHQVEVVEAASHPVDEEDSGIEVDGAGRGGSAVREAHRGDEDSHRVAGAIRSCISITKNPCGTISPMTNRTASADWVKIYS